MTTIEKLRKSGLIHASPKTTPASKLASPPAKVKRKTSPESQPAAASEPTAGRAKTFIPGQNNMSILLPTRFCAASGAGSSHNSKKRARDFTHLVAGLSRWIEVRFYYKFHVACASV